MTVNIHTKRLACACAIVLAAISAIPLGGMLTGQPAAAAQTPAASGGLRASDIVNEPDPLQALGKLERAAESAPCRLPSYFEQEIGLPAGARDVRVNGDGSVVGYVMDESPPTAFKRLCSHMEDAGWTEVPLGSVLGATFVKEEGSCTWALASCVEVGCSTSVVFRCVAR